ncbi:glycine--tRNA ligase [Candidatus Peregrinibacteria bacterium CG11_big_fil_rev_8_21_14_0_20_46_8]|nr:MAG: glycine--tRNA ligase [Candidatus Peregrinibacteria bacterium CG11_big_fil_rev_8_21_14_0_20_46_8]
MDKIVSLCKRRGFVFPGSDIYGGLANSWDFGPLGTELKNNIRDWWWKRFVHSRKDMVGLDAAIMMNPKVWETSGHVENFNDAMIDCKTCRARHRADHLIEEALPDLKVDGLEPEALTKIIRENKLKCPKCGEHNFTEARLFNQLFKTEIGKTDEDRSELYLRGEIAQAMFVNFKNVLDTMRKRLPFGIASVGKVFRNEITPGNFIFRTLEFDLMEFEYFIRKEQWKEVFEFWLNEMQNWLNEMGFHADHTRVREHTPEELSHYSDRTIDIEYNTPFGWKEMFGLAYRTDFDLTRHMEASGVDLRYTDPDTAEKFIPHVIEPTFGLSRLTLMTLFEAYHEEEAPTTEEGKTESRVVMKFHPKVAPYKVAVLPLMKKPPLLELAEKVHSDLSQSFYADFDVTGSIGKRYRRQDEIGTPYCITIDFETVEKDSAVTVRDRDSMQQERINVDNLLGYLRGKL